MKHLYAVLTGDLVGSSAAGPELREQFRQHIHTTCARLQDALPGLEPANELIGWQVFRGDSFQAVLRSAEGSVRVAVMMRAGIRSFPSPPKRALLDARVAIGIGPVDLLPQGAVGEGDGPAYRVSGKLLDSMGKRRLVLAGTDRVRTDVVRGALPLVDAVVSRWTAREAAVALLALQGRSGLAIAEALGLAPTLVSRLTRQSLVEEVGSALSDIDRYVYDEDVPI